MAWLTVKQVAELVQVHPKTVLKWANRKVNPLPCKRIGRKIIRIEENIFWDWWEHEGEAQKKPFERLVTI
jgi:excisionase family DNA binding protein